MRFAPPYEREGKLMEGQGKKNIDKTMIGVVLAFIVIVCAACLSVRIGVNGSSTVSTALLRPILALYMYGLCLYPLFCVLFWEQQV